MNNANHPPKWVVLATACLALCICSTRAASVPEEDEDPRVAVLLLVEGKGECIVDGVTKQAELGLVVPPGSTIKTAKKSELVVYFRQIGTMIRLRPETTMVLEKMIKYMKGDVLLKETVIDLQQGELMCVARVLAQESKFEIKLPGCRVVFDGAGLGRFDLNAKGNILVGKRSERPLRVTSAAYPSKTWLVAPGYSFSQASGEIKAASEQVLSQLRPKLDHLQALRNALTPPPRQVELPPSARKKSDSKR